MVGTEDYVLPVEMANDYKTQLEQKGVRCKVIFYEGQKHAFFNKKPYFQETLIETDLLLVELGILEGEPTVEPISNGR